MTDEPFSRQPKPVKVTFEGEEQDVRYYASRILAIIENNSYDNCVMTIDKASNTVSLTIYPRAVND